MALKNVHQYLSSDPGQSRTVTYIRALFFAGVLFFAGWLTYFSFQTMTMPYQIEYREGAAMVMTQILLKGENPFSPENQPAGFTSYGAGYSLFVLPLAALFGNTLFVHRAVTFVFLVLSSALVAHSLYRKNPNLLLSAACGLLVAIALAGRGGLGASANAMGVFLFLAAILIPFNRSFDDRSLIVSALLSLVAFYTKPYFVLGFAIVTSYVFLFISKQRALKSVILCALMFALTFVLFRWTSKYYFVDTIASNMYNPGKTPTHVINQLGELIKEFYSGVLIALVALLLAAGPGLKGRAGSRDLTPTRFDLRSLEAPLVTRRVDYFAWSFIISALAFCLVLGQNRGNYMTYSYQLLVPTFFLWLFKTVNQDVGVEIEALLEARTKVGGEWLVISNEVGMGVVPPYPLGRVFRDALGWANQRLARAADKVILMVAGIPTTIK